jgi:hypothetical protein
MVKKFGDFILKQLDKNDVQEVEMYEKALYKAFLGTYIKTLNRIWDIDHKSKKNKTKVSYEFQEVYVLKSQLRIYASIAANFSLDSRQFEMMGFRVDEKEEKTCEILHMFNSLDTSWGKAILETMSNNLLKLIQEQEISVIYATCSKKRLVQYTQFGFVVIQELVYFGENKYLLRKNIKDH